MNHDDVHKALGHKGGNNAVKVRKGGPEGCMISGFVMVNKVPGSLSIAAHSKHHTIAGKRITPKNTIRILHNSFLTILFLFFFVCFFFLLFICIFLFI